MKLNNYTYVLVGLMVAISAFTLTFNPGSGFCTDDSILTMTLPQKEGIETKPNIILEAELPDVPETLGIYALKSPDVTNTYLQSLAEAFGIKGQFQDQGANYVLSTEREYMSVEKASGAETLVLNYKNVYGDLEKPLPSEDALKQSASAYANRNDLLAKEYQYSGMSYLTRQLIGESGPQGRAEKMMGIAKYSRTLEGLQVVGAGSTITVLLGDGGQAQGYTKVSRNIGEKIAVASMEPEKADRTYQLLAPEEAFKLLQEKGLTIEIADVDEVVITDLKFAYYETVGDERQEVMEPVYVFSGYAAGPDGRVAIQEFMYALKVKAGKVTFEKTDRSKAIDRSDVQEPKKGTKDEELGAVLIAPLRNVTLTPRLDTGILKDAKLNLS
jgi:hypothetical protein